MSDYKTVRKVQAMYRRWLEDEKAFDKMAAGKDEPEYSDVQEVLRNLGTAIAYAQAIVRKHNERAVDDFRARACALRQGERGGEE